MAPTVPPLPTIEASVIAEKVAPNTQAWRSDAEDLREALSDQREENRLLREEIDRLKEAKHERKRTVNNDVSSGDRRTTNDSRGDIIYTVTAYTANQESTDKSAGHPAYGITASGKPVQADITAACPKELPFGTRVEIEGVGERVCTDRGGAIEGNRLDVYMPELADAREFGRQTLRVRIINEGER